MLFGTDCTSSSSGMAGTVRYDIFQFFRVVSVIETGARLPMPDWLV